MVKDLKGGQSIDLFVLMMSGDRLGNTSLIQNMKNYEALCGGKKVWDNLFIIISRKDYNPMEMEIDEWLESLEK